MGPTPFVADAIIQEAHHPVVNAHHAINVFNGVLLRSQDLMQHAITFWDFVPIEFALTPRRKLNFLRRKHLRILTRRNPRLVRVREGDPQRERFIVR